VQPEEQEEEQELQPEEQGKEQDLQPEWQEKEQDEQLEEQQEEQEQQPEEQANEQDALPEEHDEHHELKPEEQEEEQDLQPEQQVGEQELQPQEQFEKEQESQAEQQAKELDQQPEEDQKEQELQQDGQVLEQALLEMAEGEARLAEEEAMLQLARAAREASPESEEVIENSPQAQAAEPAELQDAAADQEDEDDLPPLEDIPPEEAQATAPEKEAGEDEPIEPSSSQKAMPPVALAELAQVEESELDDVNSSRAAELAEVHPLQKPPKLSSRAGSPALRAASVLANMTPRTAEAAANKLCGEKVAQHPLEPTPTPARASSSKSRPPALDVSEDAPRPSSRGLPPSAGAKSRAASATGSSRSEKEKAAAGSRPPEESVPLGNDPLGALKASKKARPHSKAPASAGELRASQRAQSSQHTPRATHSAEPAARRKDSMEPPQQPLRSLSRNDSLPPRTPPKAGWHAEESEDVMLASKVRQRAEQIAMGQSMGAKDREDSLLRMLDNRQGRNRGVL